MECDVKNLQRLAIIGTTQIAKSHVVAARKVGFDVCHVAGSKNSNTVESFAESNLISNIWSDPKELATSGEWDAIIIASAPGSLAELLLCATKSNNAVLVEKPVVLDSQLFDQFHDSTDKVIVGFNRRFYSAVMEAKKFVADRSACLIQLHVPESIMLNSDGEWDYSRVKTNSTHAFDLLSFVTGGLHDLKIDSVFRDTKKTGAVATARSNRGDVCLIVANWNAPANFALTIDSGDERFELKPLEDGVLYKGIEIVQAGSSGSRTYAPKKIASFTEPNDSDVYKPGFLGQAQALFDLTNGESSTVAATLKDAKAALLFAEALIGT
jgi:predicted dehydrogenase